MEQPATSCTHAVYTPRLPAASRHFKSGQKAHWRNLLDDDAAAAPNPLPFTEEEHRRREANLKEHDNAKVLMLSYSRRSVGVQEKRRSLVSDLSEPTEVSHKQERMEGEHNARKVQHLVHEQACGHEDGRA